MILRRNLDSGVLKRGTFFMSLGLSSHHINEVSEVSMPGRSVEAGRRPPAPAPPARQRPPEARSACDRSSAGHATPGRRAACVPAARRPRPRRLLPPLLCTLRLPSAPRSCLACRPRRVIRRGIHISSGPRRPPSTLVRADSFGSSAFLSEGLKSLSRISQEKGMCMRVTVTSCDCGESLAYHGGKRLGELFEK
ncbi:uncharacterized protein LOC112619384 [Theropithecus gelada]|uniref:uncharacterized protein LOC112619384 n=1 Tax=Theropithecus gelada TaxID=9565 RepID=UPI000DC15B64|nr:uncharacterized protein LOC112619384 [Theropithecus gelada]